MEPRLHELLAKCRVWSSRGPSDQLDPIMIYEKKIETLREFLLVQGFSATEPRPLLLREMLLKADKQREDGQKQEDRPRDELRKLDLENAAYHARAFLASTPRRVTDLWMQLRQFIDHWADLVKPEDRATKRRDVMNLLAEHTRQLLAEEHAFHSDEAQQAVEAVQREPGGDCELGPLPLSVIPSVDQGHTSHPLQTVDPPSDPPSSDPPQKVDPSSDL